MNFQSVVKNTQFSIEITIHEIRIGAGYGLSSFAGCLCEAGQNTSLASSFPWKFFEIVVGIGCSVIMLSLQKSFEELSFLNTNALTKHC